MAHEIKKHDTLALLDGKVAWHGLGTVLAESLSAYDAGLKYGLFEHPVEGLPLYTRHPVTGKYFEVSSHRANARILPDQEEPEVFGVVGSNYQICANEELARTVDALSTVGAGRVETLGSIRNGAKVWFLMRSGEFNIGSDRNFKYLLASNSHDGSNAVRLTPTSVRAVCSNTLHAVIPRFDDQMNAPEQAAISIRHSGSISDKLEAARAALESYDMIMSRNVDIYNAMAAKKVSEDDAMGLFANVYAANFAAADENMLTSDEANERRVAKLRLARMEDAANLFMTRYKSEREKFGGEDNLWLAFNGVSGYLQHDSRGRFAGSQVRRVESNLFGIGAQRTMGAFAEALGVLAS